MAKQYFKALDENFQCRGFQYEVGKTYTHDGNVEICNSGFHSCENPLDVLNYYDLTTSKFALVEVSGDLKTHSDDSKIASAQITIKAELKLHDFVANTVNYLINLCGKEKQKNANDSSQLAASGDYSQLAASGDYSQLAASGDYSQLAASGDYSQLAASGDSSKLVASGDSSKLAASGFYSQLAASGDYSQLAASGHYSKLVASGGSSKLVASGHYSKLAASGKKSIAISSGLESIAKAGKDGAIALTWFDENAARYRISVAYIGEDEIKEDAYYKLDDKGRFVECK